MARKKRVGLVTYHKALSYGACLQAYATFYIIDKIVGYDVEFIDYENEYESRQKSWKFLIRGSKKEILITLIKRIIFRNEYYKKRAFKKFLEYQKLSKIHTTKKDELNDLKYDILTVGSDQVWSPKITNGLDSVFLLDFGNPDKRISFSSSMGGYVLSSKEKEVFRTKLSSFSAISVREAFTQKQIKSLVNKEIYKILDPTLLLNKDEWRKIVRHKEIKYRFPKNSYILAFTIGEITNEVIHAYNYYSKKYKLPVYRIMLNTYRPKGINKVIPGATPYEFIDLIDNAFFVITNSFHGTAFSINMNTPFVQIPVRNNNQRMSELLEMVDLSSQSTCNNDLKNISYNINFEKVNEILNEKRKKDIEWIRKVFLYEKK